MDIFGTLEQRNKRVRNTILLFVGGSLGFLVALDLILVVWLGDRPFFSRSSLEFMFWVCVILGAVAGYQFSRLTRSGPELARLLGGVELGPETWFQDHELMKAKAAQLQNVVDELCIAACCERPAIYVLQDRSDINAFAIGRSPEDWSIVVHEGALRELGRDEIQALIGHELGHLLCEDTRKSFVFCAYIAALGAMATFGLIVTLFAAESGGGDPKSQGLGLAVALLGLAVALLGLIGWLVARMLEAKVSREQEFRADAEAVRLTRSRDGLVRLLSRFVLNPDAGASNTTAGEAYSFAEWDALSVRPLHFNRGLERFWFDSHPPALDRIRAIDPEAADALARQLGEMKGSRESSN